MRKKKDNRENSGSSHNRAVWRTARMEVSPEYQNASKTPPTPLSSKKKAVSPSFKEQAKSGIKVALHLLVSWPVVSVVIGALLLGVWQVLLGGNDFLQANLVFCFAAILLAVRIWFDLKNIVAFATICMVLVFACGTEWWWVAQKQTKSEALHVTLVTALSSSDRNQPVFWYAFTGRYGETVTPVNLLLWMKITNRSKDPIWLGNVEVEYKSHWWSWWKAIDTLPSTPLYWPLEDRKNAKLVGFTMPSTEELSQKTLESEKGYEAFSTFQYPKGNFDSVPTRLKVCDTDKNCSISYIRADQHSQGISGPQMYISPAEINLSLRRRIFWDAR